MGLIDKVCYLLPGQGSQSVGMGKYIYDKYYDKYEFIKEIFDKGNEILGPVLGYNITNLIIKNPEEILIKNPEEKLKETIYCQLAIFLTNLAYFRVLTKIKKIPCSLTLGHSIGEYSALVASGVLSLEDALKLVKTRAELMSDCIPDEKVEKGKAHYMAAVLDDNPNLINLVNKACEEGSSSGGIVGIASINSSSQIVISGNNNAVIEAVKYLRKNGIKKVVYLNVEGPFHSELMRPAAEEMKKALEDKNITINEPKIQYIANSTGNFIYDPDKIKESLVEQIYKTVKWKQSLELAINMGFKTFIESGSGEKQYKLLNRDYKPQNKGLDVLVTKDYI